MEIRQLEAFVAVMTIGSITGAARMLNRSQPAISRQIQELEAGLGGVLLQRNGPRVSPTPLGFTLYEEAERILGSVRRIEHQARSAPCTETQPLLIAATQALSLGVVATALANCASALSTCKIELLSMRPEKVVHDVLHGLAHVGVCSLPLDHQALQLHWVAQAPCLAVLPADHRLAAAPRIRLRDLAGERLIGMHNPMRLKQLVDAAWQQSLAGNTPIGVETNSSMNAQALVRAGLGVAILDPVTLRGAPLEGLVYRPLDVEIPFHFGAFTAQGKTISPQTQGLLDALRTSAAGVNGCKILAPGAMGQLTHATPDGTARRP
ncbi:LysR family transcriptional regulator [Pusillimonas sp. TS35]|uniref:LysR family transcriptional regulator n=1 Tax=Paracandidimonas lactea TaxID=2895524 RepID=UPI00136E414C|nr:LysR family transcriptional regulator [Paracandidimonas lactea]MYN11803.1 LysR family transcriptional regulator [Pusillimonas sp. TS35]